MYSTRACVCECVRVRVRASEIMYEGGITGPVSSRKIFSKIDPTLSVQTQIFNSKLKYFILNSNNNRPIILNPYSLTQSLIRNDLTISSLQDIIECKRVYESNSRVDKGIRGIGRRYGGKGMLGSG